MEGSVALVVEAACVCACVVGGDVAVVDQDCWGGVAAGVLGERGIVAYPLCPLEAAAVFGDRFAKPHACVLDVGTVGIVDELDFGCRGCHHRLG